MKHMKPLRKTFWAVAFILLCSTLAIAQVVRPRNPNAPVVKPSEETKPAPGADKGIIIVGGKGNKPIETITPPGPMETRDAGPKITSNPNPVYIPKGQTQTQATINWDVGPGLWYCEIFMSINGGEESELGRGHDGAKPVTIELGSNYDFKMVVYSGENGENPTTVTSLSIKGQLQPETPPPSGGGGGGTSRGMFKVKPGAAKDIAIQFFLNPRVKPSPILPSPFRFRRRSLRSFSSKSASSGPIPRPPSESLAVRRSEQRFLPTPN